MPFRWSAQATRTTSAVALSALLLTSAVKHFRTPSFYKPVVPDYLCRDDEPGSRPNGPLAVMSREEWIASSGLLEAAVAVGLLVPATRKVAADATTAMFTAFLAGHIDALRRAYGPTGTKKERRIHTLRLPLQLPLILWSWSLRK
jgi:uncharacterized membrane protein